MVGQFKKYKCPDAIVLVGMFGMLVSGITSGCRNNQLFDDKTAAPADQTSSILTQETKKSLSLATETLTGKVELKAIPLGSVGTLGAFWRAKNLKVETLTSLALSEELLDSQDTTMSQASSTILGRAEAPSATGSEIDREGLRTPEGVTLFLKKIEFISDEDMLSSEVSGLQTAAIPSGAEGMWADEWSFKLNQDAERDLVEIFSLANDDVFESLRDRTYTNPDQLLLDLEVVLKERANLAPEPKQLQKASEVLAKRLEEMVSSPYSIAGVDSTNPGLGDLAKLPKRFGGDQHPPTTFGPFKVELRSSWEAAAKPGGWQATAGTTHGDEHGEIYEVGSDPKMISSLTLAPGLYRSVRLTWGAVAQVKGCVEEGGKETLCTKPGASPYVINANLRDFSVTSAEFMDVPTTNDDSKWPLSGDWSQEYGVDLEVKEGAVSQLNIVFPLAGALRFYRPDGAYDRHDLLPEMPRNRPYFFMPSLKDRMLLTARSLGRLYEFAGTATNCLVAATKAQPNCTPSSSKASGTVLQILTDGAGTPMRALWQYTSHGMQAAESAPAHSDPSLWLDSFSSEAGMRGQRRSDGGDNETALWLHPAGSLLGDESDMIQLEGLPLALDRWQIGESKILWAKAVSGAVSPKDSGKSAGKTRPNTAPKEAPIQWVKVQLKRLL